MHSYSIDTDERIKVIFYLSGLSILLSYGISYLLSSTSFSFFHEIQAPSAFVIFGLVYKLFDRKLWKMRIFHKIRVVETPDLNGTWEGTCYSSIKNEQTGENHQLSTELLIDQSWTKIRIISKNGKSTSCSEVAGIKVKDNMGEILCFQFKNEPGYKTPDTMNDHIGYNKLRILTKDSMEGNYFTDRNRKSYGELKYVRNH